MRSENLEADSGSSTRQQALVDRCKTKPRNWIESLRVDNSEQHLSIRHTASENENSSYTFMHGMARNGLHGALFVDCKKMTSF